MTVDELHGDETPLGRLTDVVDGDDVGMIQRRGGNRFATKPIHRSGSGAGLGQDQLERHVAAKPSVTRAIDLAHAAGANRCLNGVRPNRVPGK